MIFILFKTQIFSKKNFSFYNKINDFATSYLYINYADVLVFIAGY